MEQTCVYMRVTMHTLPKDISSIAELPPSNLQPCKNKTPSSCPTSSRVSVGRHNTTERGKCHLSEVLIPAFKELNDWQFLV